MIGYVYITDTELCDYNDYSAACMRDDIKFGSPSVGISALVIYNLICEVQAWRRYVAPVTGKLIYDPKTHKIINVD